MEHIGTTLAGTRIIYTCVGHIFHCHLSIIQRSNMIFLLLLHVIVPSSSFQVYNLTSSVPTVQDVDSLETLLDVAWTFQPSAFLLQLRVPVPAYENSLLYECADGTQIPRRLQPWHPMSMIISRRFYASMAATLAQHPARTLIDHIVLSWTSEADDDEWRHPTSHGTCWYSQAAQQSFAHFMSLDTPTVPGSNVPTNTTLIDAYWQQVDNWYQTSLLEFGRAQLQMANAAFGPLGLRLLVRFPAFPFLNPHWAFVAGYGGGENGPDANTTASAAGMRALLDVVEQCSRLFQNNIDIFLPGIDQLFVSPMDEWSEAVEWAHKRQLQVYTGFRTHLVQTQLHWQEVHGLMQIHDVAGFIGDTVNEVQQTAIYLQPFARGLRNPYRARVWRPMRIAATHSNPNVWAVVFAPVQPTVKIPIQVMIPDRIQANELWLLEHNFQFHLQSTWSTPLFALSATDVGHVGIPNLDPTKRWWAWTGLIDCDLVAPLSGFQARVNASFAQQADEQDVYELPCGGNHILDLALHTIIYQ